MKAILRRCLIACLFCLVAGPALGQAPPANLPYHTLYGRLGAAPGDTGPGQAIPFSVLAPQLSLVANSAVLPLFIASGGGFNLGYNSSLITDGSNLLGINLAHSNSWAVQQTINLNPLALPTPSLGTILEFGNANGVNTTVEATSFGATAVFQGRASLGTAASPSAPINNTLLLALSATGYAGGSWSSNTAGGISVFAEGTWSGMSHPTRVCDAVTAIGSTVASATFCLHQDSGVTLGSPTGGDEGPYSINTQGPIFVNGVQISLFPVATRAGDVVYWSGSGWVNFPGNNSGTNCYAENAVGSPQWSACSGGGGGSPGGSSGQIQYNAAGSFGGLSTVTTSSGNLTISNNNGGLILNDPGANIAFLAFQDHGTSNWFISSGPALSDNLSITDQVAGRTVLQAVISGNMWLMPTSGGLSMGNSLVADNSGHPYCDVTSQAFGTAGHGSNSADQTAIAAALSACSGGVVFFPCGAYGNTATWTVPAFTRVVGASRACVSITTTQTSNDIFLCASGTNGPQPTEFSEMQIYGVGLLTTGSVPNGGYAINCGVGGNQQTFFNLEIAGTYNGINIGGTNGRLRDSRFEQIYGAFVVNELGGGNTIEGNQLDNNSVFNATGGAGFGNYNPYVTGSAALYNTGAMVFSNGYVFVATVGGTSAPQAGGLSAVPMYKNITDGSVTWQLIGATTLIIVNPGTETWIIDNDMTSPANIAINLDGGSSNNAVRNWIRGNDIGGELEAGVYFTNGPTLTTIAQNNFQSIGYNQSGATTGYPIYDNGPGDSSETIVTGNNFTNIVDAAIILKSDSWIINANFIKHNQTNSQFCGIQMFTVGPSPAGTNITGNIIFNASPGTVCMSSGGGTNTIVVGNTLFGSSPSLSGTSASAGNL